MIQKSEIIEIGSLVHFKTGNESHKGFVIGNKMTVSTSKKSTISELSYTIVYTDSINKNTLLKKCVPHDNVEKNPNGIFSQKIAQWDNLSDKVYLDVLAEINVGDYDTGKKMMEYEHPVLFKIKMTNELKRQNLYQFLSKITDNYGIVHHVNGLKKDDKNVNVQFTITHNDNERMNNVYYRNGGTALGVPKKNEYYNTVAFIGFSRIDGLPMFKTYRYFAGSTTYSSLAEGSLLSEVLSNSSLSVLNPDMTIKYNFDINDDFKLTKISLNEDHI